MFGTDLGVRLRSRCVHYFQMFTAWHLFRFSTPFSCVESVFALCFFLLWVNNAGMQTCVGSLRAHDGLDPTEHSNRINIVILVI